MQAEKKRKREQKIVSFMIQLYCRKNHGIKNGLCTDCAELSSYAIMRSEHFPFMEQKTFCSNCRVHCYVLEMRERIRAVMRFSGPRMMMYHPLLAVRHLLENKKEKKRMEKNHE